MLLKIKDGTTDVFCKSHDVDENKQVASDQATMLLKISNLILRVI